jgi:hypothetical protein
MWHWFTGTSPNPDGPSDASEELLRCTWEPLLLLLLFVAALTWWLHYARVGWNGSVSDFHGFRQSQTALTAVYLQKGGPLFHYETPVVGAPWSVPFELPVYQWTVAKLATIGALGITQSGRLVNEVLFFLSLGALWLLLGELFVVPVHRLAFLALVLVSPVYLFWSRTVMIESTAFFFSLLAVYLVARFVRSGSIWVAAVSAVAGTIAMAVKGTTYPAFALAALVIVGADALRRWTHETWRPRAIRILLALFALGVAPLVGGVAWMRFGEAVRRTNPIGARLALVERGWYYGTLHQRFEAATWNSILDRMIPDSVGAVWVIALAAAALAVSRRRVAEASTALLCFASLIALFTNLHVVHNYYQYANGIFLVAVCGFAVLALLESGGRLRVVGFALLAIFGIVNARTYWSRFLPAQSHARTDLVEMGTLVAEITAADEVVAATGLDWSSELPYYADRRGLILPDWLDHDPDSEILRSEREALDASGAHVGAYLACGNQLEDFELAPRLASSFGLSPIPLSVGGCRVFVADGRRATLTMMTISPH